MKHLYSIINQSVKQFAFHKKISNSYHRLFHTSSSLQFPIQSVVVQQKDELVVVEYSNGKKDSFPWHFLQDNCTCPECFHAASQSRKKRMTTLDLDKTVSGAKVVENNNNNSGIHLTWSDGHEGTFSESWLQARSFSPQNCAQRRVGFRDDPQLIDAKHEIKRLGFQEVLENDEKLLDCLSELCKVGVVMLENTPKSVGQLRKLSEKVGFIRTTHYGNEFTVRSVPDAVNLAYTSTTLTVHTDLPYYAYPPCVQALHCIKQFYGEQDEAIGGESHLVDGFIVARHMQDSSSDALREQYNILCETPVEFYDIGKDYTKFHKVHHSPTFVKSQLTKKLDRIVYSNQQLSSYLPIDLEKAQLFYKAMKTFTDLCYNDKYLMRFKLKEGEILIFDNWRFLHGRSEFDSSKGERHLEGCYLDWDEVFSTMRVLQSDRL